MRTPLKTIALRPNGRMEVDEEAFNQIGWRVEVDYAVRKDLKAFRRFLGNKLTAFGARLP